MFKIKLGLTLLLFLNAFFSAWGQANQPGNVARITFAPNNFTFITRVDYLSTLNESERHIGRSLTQDERLIVVDGLINELLLLRAADLWFDRETKNNILNTIRTQHEEKFSKQYSAMSTSERKELEAAHKTALIQGFINERMISAIPKPTEQEILNFYNENRNILVQPNTNRTLGLDEMLPSNVTVRRWVSDYLHRQKFLNSFRPTEQEVLNFYNENRQAIVHPETNRPLGIDDTLPSNMTVRNWIINFIIRNKMEAATYRITMIMVQELRGNIQVDYYRENF